MAQSDMRAEVLLPTDEIRDDIPFYTKTLGFRMDSIFPADDPTEASFSGHGLALRIRKGADVAPGILRILTDDVNTRHLRSCLRQVRSPALASNHQSARA